MKLLLYAPLFIAVVFFLIVLIQKKKPFNEKQKHQLLLIGIGCCVLAIIAVLISVFISGDKKNLFSLSCPVIILILAAEQMRQNKKKNME